MIDYEKLKEANKLCEQLKYENICLGFYINAKPGEHAFFIVGDGMSFYFYNDIELIAKLRELTQPNTPHKIGDTIWFSNQHMAIDYLKIESIDIVENDIFYRGNGCQVALSDKIYSSKNELIDAQIEKLRKMKYE